MIEVRNKHSYSTYNNKYKNQTQFKHEFVDLDENNKLDVKNNDQCESNVNSPNENFKSDNEVNKENNINIENINMNVAIKYPQSENEKISNTQEERKTEFVDIDVEKMFSSDSKNLDLPNKLESHDPRSNSEYTDHEIPEENEEFEDENEHLEEESSGSIDNDYIEAEFEKFTKMANLENMGQMEYDDYNDFEMEKTKNNKVIFEDDFTHTTHTKQTSNDKVEEDTQNIPNEDENNMKETTRNFMNSLKSIDPKVLMEIRNKLSEDDKNIKKDDAAGNNNQQTLDNAQTNVQNLQMLGNLQNNTNNNAINQYNQIFYQKNYFALNNKVPIQNYLFSNYAHFFYRGRDSNIHREYFALKCL